MKNYASIETFADCYLNMTLADAMNTYNPALDLITKKGYKVWIEPSDNEEEFGDWLAMKEGYSFSASDPLRLLAVITIWEERGASRNTGNGNLYDKLLEEAFGA